MLDIRIPITPATIEALKAQLQRALPQVNSCHRTEAMARGLGFRTYAAMLSAARAGSQLSSAANGGAFKSYLSMRRFEAEATHFYRAVAYIAIVIVLDQVPRLSMRGYGFGPPRRKSDGSWESSHERYASFKIEREEFLTDHGADEFLLAFSFVRRVNRINSISARCGSYRLKHIAENMACVTADGTQLGPRYVSNGALIAAAIYCGVKMRTFFDHLGYDAINVSFNMSKKSIDDLDCEIRPDGACAQDRKRQAELRRLGRSYRYAV
jgi:hypothetical protein